ncbi:MAG: terminase small subunit [Magnetospirillum sp.]|nr:terminase small subunit [Magnetospirillum sp.]
MAETILEADGLSDQQRLFVAEYLIDQNGAKAYVRAGYSPEGATAGASRLLANVNVRAAIDAALKAQLESRVSESERILTELRAVAFSRTNRAARWGDGKVNLIGSDAIDDDTLAAIAEVSETPGPHGIKLKIKMHPKLPALIRLAEREGVLDKTTSGGEDDITRDDTFGSRPVLSPYASS